MINSQSKSVGSPTSVYEYLSKIWAKNRAVCGGERFVKEFDSTLDTNTFSNLLIPFSVSMSAAQYNFYRSEAELPGISSQLGKTLVGGLLRKPPTLGFPDNIPNEIPDWILNEFGQDDSPLVSFLDEALWEEIQTSACWVFVTHPQISGELDEEAAALVKPYPVIWPAETVINTRVSINEFGKKSLSMIIVKGYVEKERDNEFHPVNVETVWVHELVDGKYRVRVFEKDESLDDPEIKANKKVPEKMSETFKEVRVIDNILMNDKPLTYIPAWPLSGSYEPTEPLLTAIVDKEVALYNKMSRRNHLLYGSATYTPWIKSGMDENDFNTFIKGKGLGTWFNLDIDDEIGVLATPTEALDNMEKTIAASIEEMARLGVRMLSPESNQSGVALHLRNAPQNAQLGLMNTRVSAVMRQVISLMIEWKYDLKLSPSDIEFSLSTDFKSIPLGEEWVRLVTEWYQESLIPRSLWLTILRHNDIVPSEYNDDDGKVEITDGQDMLTPKTNERFAKEYLTRG